jgi:hypothetical protein
VNEPDPFLQASPSEARIVLALTDFKSVLVFIEIAQKHEVASIEYEALVECAVIRYARAFVPNEKKGVEKNAPVGSRLELTAHLLEFLQRLPDSPLETHKRVLELRHTVVAHVPGDLNPVAVADPPPSLPVHGFGYKGRPQRLVDAKLDLIQFSNLVHWMQHYFMIQLGAERSRERVRKGEPARGPRPAGANGQW